MAQVETYAADSVAFILGGWRVEGWNRISVFYESPQFRVIKGIRGKNSRVRNTNTAAVIEVELASGNDASMIFDQIVAGDHTYGTARFNLQIKDILGLELFFSNEAFVEGFARRDYEGEASSRVWKIHCLSSSITSNVARSAFDQIGERIGGLF